ncbi:MAG: phosphoribosylglycinamide synthetase C domain-containing protein, partial [Acidimicrobiia bacterium]
QSPVWSDAVAVDVVLASPGYPDDVETGFDITGLDEVSDAIVFHAGTATEGSRLVTSGGRVVNVVGVGETIRTARIKAYAAAGLIDFRGKQFRDDIAAT